MRKRIEFRMETIHSEVGHAYPDQSGTVLIQRQELIARKTSWFRLVVPEAHEGSRVPVKPVQASAKCPNPQVTGAVLEYRPDPIIAQTQRVRLIMPIVCERFCDGIELIQPFLRAHPHAPFTITVDTVNPVINEGPRVCWIVPERLRRSI